MSKNYDLTLIRLKPKQMEQLKERKKNIGVSIAEQIRIAVYEYLKRANRGGIL